MSKRVLVSFALIFICLFSISAAWALDMDSSDLNKNIGTNLENNFNTDSNNNLDSNLNSNFNSNLNSNIDNSTQELDLSPKNFKALSSNSSIGGGANSSVNLSSNQNSQDNSIIIDDTNYDTYFDNQGFLSSDIKANSLIYFGNLSNKYIRIDLPLTLSSLNETTIFNSTIEVLMDGSFSNLTNLNFYTNATSENSNYFTPIYINGANNLLIEKNFIYMDYYDGCNYNLAGIYAISSSNNIIRNNRISIFPNNITDNQKKYYIYGIDFSIYNSESSSASSNNTVIGNTIDLYSNYYLSGILFSCSNDGLISGNKVHLNSLQFAYGIVCEYFSNPSSKECSNISIIGNDLSIDSNMVYLIQLFTVHDINISSNILSSISNASYGISAYESFNLNIQDNDITVRGNDTSLIGFNVDAISTGHNGMYFMKNSHDINITENNVLSLYQLGQDYAIRFADDSNSNVTVAYNNLSSNNYTYSGNEAIYGNVTAFDNNPYSDAPSESEDSKMIIRDIYVNLEGSDEYGNGSIDNPFASVNQALIYLKDLNLLKEDNATVKGIVHIGEGTYSGNGRNLRLYITDLTVDLIGEGYNKTIFSGDLKNWFFDISKTSTVNIRNLTFLNGIYRNTYGGLIYNRGNLNLENCIFINSKLVNSSAIIYNDGLLRLKNNILNLTSVNGYQIYNNGLIDNLVLSFIGDSPNEEDRVINVNSSRMNLSAYLHDDRGNLVSGGFIKFFIQSKEFVPEFDVYYGETSNEIILSLMGNLKVSGYYSGSYTNTFINLGKIISSVNLDDVAFYVSEEGDDANDGSKENPFRTIKKALSSLDSVIDHTSIYLADGNYSIPNSYINAPYGLSIIGSNQTYIKGDWNINSSNSSIELKNLIFNGSSITCDSINLTVKNCSFLNAPISAIRAVDTNLTVINSNFMDNGCADHSTTFTVFPFDMNDFNLGGAIYNIKGDLTVIDSNFINNGAVFGGAIFNNQSDLHISSSNFIGNLASAGLCVTPSFGGAIYQYLGKEIIVSDCLFSNNSATGWGGAFYSSGTQPNMVKDDMAQRPEYDVENSFQEIYFINTIFDNNMAPNGGGALYIINNSFTEYISCIFRNNVVYTYYAPNMAGFGGGKNWIDLDDINNERDSFSSSQVDLGGAFYDNNVHILDSSFEANTYNSGGALILPTVIHNSVEYDYISLDLPVHIEDSGSGGQSIYVADSSFLTSEDSKFLGISGWNGNSTGNSITRSSANAGDNGILRTNSSSNDDNSNSGSGGSGSGDINIDSGGSGSGDSESGDGGTGGSGDSSTSALSLDDILGYLKSYGSDLVSSNGSSFSLEDLYGMIYTNISSNESDNAANVNSSSDSTANSSDVNSTVSNSSDSSNSSSDSHISNSTDSNSSSSDSHISNSTDSSNSSSDFNNSESNDSNSTITNSTVVESSDSPDVDFNSSDSSDIDSISDDLEYVNDSSDIVLDDFGFQDNKKDNDDSSVGTTGEDLSGESLDASADSSKSAKSSNQADSPGTSSSSSNSPKAYQIQKEEPKSSIDKNINLAKFTLILIFSLLILIGYYRKSKEEE